MKIDSLIEQLAKNVQPVPPIPSVRIRFWTLIAWNSLIVAVGLVSWYLLKGEIHVPMGRSLLGVLALSGCILFGLWKATRSASPHTAQISIDKKSALFFLLWIAITAFAFTRILLQNHAGAWEALKYNTWFCPLVTYSVAIPAAIASYLYLKKGWVVFKTTAALYWALSTVALGLLTLAFICPWADPLHELLWHVGPGLVGCTFLFYLARRFI